MHKCLIVKLEICGQFQMTTKELIAYIKNFQTEIGLAADIAVIFATISAIILLTLNIWMFHNQRKEFRETDKANKIVELPRFGGEFRTCVSSL